jgi:hypothetical protein
MITRLKVKNHTDFNGIFYHLWYQSLEVQTLGIVSASNRQAQERRIDRRLALSFRMHQIFYQLFFVVFQIPPLTAPAFV